MQTTQKEFVEFNHLLTLNLHESGPIDPRRYFVCDTTRTASVRIAEVSENFRQLMEEVGIETPKSAVVQPILVASRQPIVRAFEALKQLSRDNPYLQLIHFYSVLISWGELEVKIPEEGRPIYRFFAKTGMGVWEVNFERGSRGAWHISANRETVFSRLEPLEVKDILLCALPPTRGNAVSG